MSEITSPIMLDSTGQTIAGKLDNINASIGGNANIAPVFNTTTAYSKGDMVNYSGNLYVFTANHAAGAWTGSDAVQTKVSSELATLKSGLTNLGNIKAITLSAHGTLDINIRNIAFMLYATSNSDVFMDTVSATLGYLDSIIGDKTSSKKFTYTKVSDGVITVTSAVNWAVTAIILN